MIKYKAQLNITNKFIVDVRKSINRIISLNKSKRMHGSMSASDERIFKVGQYVSQMDYESLVNYISHCEEDRLKLINLLVYLYGKNICLFSEEKAVDILKDIKSNACLYKAWTLLIEYYLFKSNKNEASKYIEKYKEIDEGYYYYLLGNSIDDKKKKLDCYLEAVTALKPCYKAYLKIGDVAEDKEAFYKLAVIKRIENSYSKLGGHYKMINDELKMTNCFKKGEMNQEIDSLKSLVKLYIKMQDFEGVEKYRKKLFLAIEKNERLELLELIIKMNIECKDYDKALRLAKFYQKSDYVNASFLLVEIYERKDNYKTALDILFKLAKEYKNKRALKRIGEYYIYGYGVIKRDVDKGITLIQRSGLRSGREIISICYLKGMCGEEMIEKGFMALAQTTESSKTAALYVYACYFYQYFVGKDQIEEVRLYNLLLNKYRMKKIEINAFLLNNSDLNKKNIKYPTLASRILF